MLPAMGVPAGQANRKLIIGIALGIAAVGLVIRATVSRGSRGPTDLRASGTVEATEAQLGFVSPGLIATMSVREGDRVASGQELARLDTADLGARLAQARAGSAAARARLRELEAGARVQELEQARDAAQATREEYLNAQRELARTQLLVRENVTSQQALDRAQLAVEVTKRQSNHAQQQLQLLEEGTRPEQLAAQRARVLETDAVVRQIEVNLRHAVIRAPFDGVITVRNGEPGEIVGAGASVLTVRDLADRWVRIYVPEDVIGAVKLAQPAVITVDTYREKTYSGAVSFIASGAEFTPRNVQTAEERVKLVYAVKVRVTGDPTNDLKPGMPADVRLEIRPSSGPRP